MRRPQAATLAVGRSRVRGSRGRGFAVRGSGPAIRIGSYRVSQRVSAAKRATGNLRESPGEGWRGAGINRGPREQRCKGVGGRKSPGTKHVRSGSFRRRPEGVRGAWPGHAPAVRRARRSGHLADAAAGRERGRRHRVGRDGHDAGRHRRLLFRASGERDGCRRPHLAGHLRTAAGVPADGQAARRIGLLGAGRESVLPDEESADRARRARPRRSPRCGRSRRH